MFIVVAARSDTNSFAFMTKGTAMHTDLAGTKLRLVLPNIVLYLLAYFLYKFACCLLHIEYSVQWNIMLRVDDLLRIIMT